jgi:hypothetical protein
LARGRRQLTRAHAARIGRWLSVIVMIMAVRGATAEEPSNHGRALRGITVGPIESSQHAGRGYGSPASVALLDELKRMGANAVSITPFGRLWDLHSTFINREFERPYAANRADVIAFATAAKARGMYVLLIPHLWVETLGWRGDFDAGTDERWSAYQAAYRELVLSWADAAQAAHVDAFSIGVECKSWSGRFGGYWSSLIAEVRQHFSGALTYSANWDEADNVLFWDQLDFIGINAFYPLAAHGGASYSEYAQGAERALARAGALGQLLHEPVVFTEIGYTTRRDAAVEPWLWPDTMTGETIDEWEQARALSALIGAAVSKPWFAGFFVWRYYADLDDISQEAAWGFSPHAKLAERVLQNVFGSAWAADADANDQGWMITPKRLE